MHGITTRSKVMSLQDQKLPKNLSLPKVMSQWDKTIRLDLKQLALTLWPDTHLFGVIPQHNYRLRKQVSNATAIWWIEHDIPPYYLYRCVAYQVELSVLPSSPQRLIVRSGAAAYAVNPLNAQSLQAALIRARSDPPLHINRAFGTVLDP